MTLVCAGLLTTVLGERLDLGAARRLFVPLIVLALASVSYWDWTERRGAGDLRPYALVQYGSLLAIVLMLVLFPARRRGTPYLIAALSAYGGAKLFELADKPIFELTRHVVSGHTLKHLVAAIGLACLVAMVHAGGRTPIEAPEPRG
jgi:hypothetical protein